jgi:hypothetical protein
MKTKAKMILVGRSKDDGRPIYEADADGMFLRDNRGLAYFDDGTPVYLDAANEDADAVEFHIALLSDAKLYAHDEMLGSRGY